MLTLSDGEPRPAATEFTGKLRLKKTMRSLNLADGGNKCQSFFFFSSSSSSSGGLFH